MSNWFLDKAIPLRLVADLPGGAKMNARVEPVWVLSTSLPGCTHGTTEEYVVAVCRTKREAALIASQKGGFSFRPRRLLVVRETVAGELGSSMVIVGGLLVGFSEPHPPHVDELKKRAMGKLTPEEVYALGLEGKL